VNHNYQQSIKIFNDPVYGFIRVPKGLIFDIIEHRYFQRLRRIGQTSLAHYVYPGALHTRFHHALGAFHLMTESLDVLRIKGIQITEQEYEAAQIAILLHDIGHGAFSHTLEHNLIEIHHEEMSLLFMKALNEEFEGKLSLAIEIFEGSYSKRFLHQLVSGQLDMDRMDYLNRDSFFTGVAEGVIGYDRIIKMLSVVNDDLVVEEKGLYSLERFLSARRLMYWQVYLHKTVLSAEKMLVSVIRRAKYLYLKGESIALFGALKFLFETPFFSSKALFEAQKAEKMDVNVKKMLNHFAMLDDFDIIASLKLWTSHTDFILSFLSSQILERKLFKLTLQNEPISAHQVERLSDLVLSKFASLSPEDTPFLLMSGAESNRAYATNAEIQVLFKDGKVVPLSSCVDIMLHSQIITKFYLCYPKNLS
jgi:HD superfamily phosphohydrolase